MFYCLCRTVRTAAKKIILKKETNKTSSKKIEINFNRTDETRERIYICFLLPQLAIMSQSDEPMPFSIRVQTTPPRAHSAALRESTTFWSLWWRITLSILYRPQYTKVDSLTEFNNCFYKNVNTNIKKGIGVLYGCNKILVVA